MGQAQEAASLVLHVLLDCTEADALGIEREAVQVAPRVVLGPTVLDVQGPV